MENTYKKFRKISIGQLQVTDPQVSHVDMIINNQKLSEIKYLVKEVNDVVTRGCGKKNNKNKNNRSKFKMIQTQNTTWCSLSDQTILQILIFLMSNPGFQKENGQSSYSFDVQLHFLYGNCNFLNFSCHFIFLSYFCKIT